MLLRITLVQNHDYNKDSSTRRHFLQRLRMADSGLLATCDLASCVLACAGLRVTAVSDLLQIYSTCQAPYGPYE